MTDPTGWAEPQRLHKPPMTGQTPHHQAHGPWAWPARFVHLGRGRMAKWPRYMATWPRRIVIVIVIVSVWHDALAARHGYRT